MFIQESELFKGLDDHIMSEISRIMIEESCKSGQVLYTENDRAENFYLLWDGRIRLSIGTEAEIDYTVSKRGEAFGWSSLVDRDTYTARAECVADSNVYRVPKAKVEELFAKHPEAGMVFYKRLAAAIVQRLIWNYGAFLSEGSLKGVTSEGTRQVAAAGED
jgi:CRP-like cAMP-binding protein